MAKGNLANNPRSGPCGRCLAAVTLAALLLALAGCAASPEVASRPRELAAHRLASRPLSESDNPLALAAYLPHDDPLRGGGADANCQPLEAPAEPVATVETLMDLETLAQSLNPGLRRIGQEVAAAEAKTVHVGKLPDPTLGADFFTHPIETAAGSQRARVTVMQMIPWLGRLDAQSQRAFFEAMALQQAYQANRLKVVSDVRVLWFRLYVLEKQIETTRANQQILQPLVDVATDRVRNNLASQADVRLGTLAISKLEEQILVFRQQVASTKAELNRVIGRDADHPIVSPQRLDSSLPDWSHEMLRQIAWEQQPQIAAAELRTKATSWGIEVARLQRRPSISLNASWFAIDDNRPAVSIVDVGRDAWSLGAQVSLPLWHHKYDALEEEAVWEHSASHASVEETRQRYDALLRDLWEKAQTAAQTASLYQATLRPQAQETLVIDQESYANGTVDFDRLIEDVRSLLMIELGYHRAIGELATVLARIQEAVGTDLPVAPVVRAPLPPPDAAPPTE